MNLTIKQRVLIVTDAWYPFLNGVVTCIDNLASELRNMGHKVLVIHSQLFATIREPSDATVRLSVNVAWRLPQMIDEFRPTMIHISTEGPVGLGARAYCIHEGLSFTTAIHSKFPEFFHQRTGFPKDWAYQLMKGFHSRAERVLVATDRLKDHLLTKGFHPDHVTVVQFLGVDTGRFVDGPLLEPGGSPDDDNCSSSHMIMDLPRPLHIYVGRVAVEKNIDQFLALSDLGGTKMVVGDGPLLSWYQRAYPTVRFVGQRTGEELVRFYQAADVLVFPSRTDTFGLVLLESLACGTPVAALPVPGPLDVITDSNVGVLDTNLGAAVDKALHLSSEDCRTYALQYAWSKAAGRFLHAQEGVISRQRRQQIMGLDQNKWTLLRFLRVMIHSWSLVLILWVLYPPCVTLTFVWQLYRKVLASKRAEPASLLASNHRTNEETNKDELGCLC